MITFRYINNSGGGFHENAEVVEGTTIHSFLSVRHPGINFEHHQIRFTPQNGIPSICTDKEVLMNGSRLTITPNQVSS